MCNPPNYCSYCLKRMKTSALKTNNINKANQLQSLIDEKENLKKKEAIKIVSKKIDISSIQGKIAVDIDDTVGDFIADMRAAVAIRDGLTYEQALEKYPENPANGIASWFPDAEDPDKASYELFEDLEKRGLLYKNQPVRSGAGEVLNWLNKESNGKVTFLTARPEKFNTVSQWWLEKNVGVDFPVSISNSTKKEEVEDYDVLIDDSVPHIAAVSSPEAPHGPRQTIFMTRPRSNNAIEENDKVIKAWSWKDVKNIFQKEEENK